VAWRRGLGEQRGVSNFQSFMNNSAQNKARKLTRARTRGSAPRCKKKVRAMGFEPMLPEEVVP
jgi:hypothetical protein